MSTSLKCYKSLYKVVLHILSYNNILDVVSQVEASVYRSYPYFDKLEQLFSKNDSDVVPQVGASVYKLYPYFDKLEGCFRKIPSQSPPKKNIFMWNSLFVY